MMLLIILMVQKLVFAQFKNIYPIQGQTYYQLMERQATISENEQFVIQQILTFHPSSTNLSKKNAYILVPSMIIDVSVGTVNGNPNLENNLIAILYEQQQGYEIYISKINSNGAISTLSIFSQIISNQEYQCFNIILVNEEGFVQCATLNTGQLIIVNYQLKQSSLTQIPTNINFNCSLVQNTDLQYYVNSTGTFLISTIVAQQSNIYSIAINSPNNIQNIYTSSLIYNQLLYLPSQNILILLDNTSFQIQLNDQILFNLSVHSLQFVYHLYDFENTVIISLLTQTQILVYGFAINKQFVNLLQTLERNNSIQEIFQFFVNTDYIVLSGYAQLEVYSYFTSNESISTFIINQTSFSYFLTQSNYIGMIINNNTQLAIQINQPALICASCSGNGTFNLTYDGLIEQYNYQTLEQNDNGIYITDSIANYTSNYPATNYYNINNFIGSNMTIDIAYPNNSYIDLFIYSFDVINNTLQGPANYFAIYYDIITTQFLLIFKNPNTMWNSVVYDSYDDLYMSTLIELDDQNFTVYSSVYYQPSEYQSSLYLNRGNYVQNLRISLFYYPLPEVDGPPINISADLNSSANIIAMALMESYLFIQLPDLLLIYDVAFQPPSLQQQFQIDCRNIWTSDDYPGYLFCDAYTQLAIYQFDGASYITILNIPYQIMNTSSMAIGLITKGIYISLQNATNQGLYFYNRQNIQPVQLNQIPFQTIPVSTIMTTLTYFTQKFFYIYVLNNNNSELSIYQASESGFGSLYKSIYIIAANLTQFTCSTHQLDSYDLCATVWSDGSAYSINILHNNQVMVANSFSSESVSIQANTTASNTYSQQIAQSTYTVNNPLIQIQTKTEVDSVVTNSTQGQVYISPQQYFAGNIQNYTITSNNSQVNSAPLMILQASYPFKAIYTIQASGYTYLGNLANMSIINGTNINILYTQPNKVNQILITFTEVNTGYASWVVANKTGLYFMYYNLSNLQVQQQQITDMNLGGSDMFYFDGPLIVIASNQYSLYCFNISYIDNQFQFNTLINYQNLNQALINSLSIFPFRISQTFVGLMYQSIFGSFAVISLTTINGTVNIAQSIIQFNERNLRNAFMTSGQQYGNTVTEGNTSQIQVMIGAAEITFEMNLNFYEELLVSYKIINEYYVFGFTYPEISDIYVARSNNVTVVAQVFSTSLMISQYPQYNYSTNSQIQTISYFTNVTIQGSLNSFNQLSDNILVYSFGSVTYFYQVSPQLEISYQINQNQSDIVITAQNQYFQSTQNLLINQWQAPNPPPTPPINEDGSNSFNYWLTLWITLCLIVIVILVGIGFYINTKVQKRQQEKEIQLNLQNYEKL